MGINIELPFEQSVNPYVDAAFAHSTFFSRLHHLVLLSDAFVVVPDGIGSLLEMSLAWQLLQVHQLHNTPLIVCGEMWEDLIDWSRGAMGQPGNELASAEDFDIPKSVETIDQAVAIIRENREKWLASRSGE